MYPSWAPGHLHQLCTIPVTIIRLGIYWYPDWKWDGGSKGTLVWRGSQNSSLQHHQQHHPREQGDPTLSSSQLHNTPKHLKEMHATPLGLCQQCPGWTLEIVAVASLTTLWHWPLGGPSLPYHSDLVGGRSPAVGPLTHCGQASTRLQCTTP